MAPKAKRGGGGRTLKQLQARLGVPKETPEKGSPLPGAGKENTPPTSLEAPAEVPGSLKKDPSGAPPPAPQSRGSAEDVVHPLPPRATDEGQTTPLPQKPTTLSPSDRPADNIRQAVTPAAVPALDNLQPGDRTSLPAKAFKQLDPLAAPFVCPPPQPPAVASIPPSKNISRWDDVCLLDFFKCKPMEPERAPTSLYPPAASSQDSGGYMSVKKNNRSASHADQRPQSGVPSSRPPSVKVSTLGEDGEPVITSHSLTGPEKTGKFPSRSGRGRTSRTTQEDPQLLKDQVAGGSRSRSSSRIPGAPAGTRRGSRAGGTPHADGASGRSNFEPSLLPGWNPTSPGSGRGTPLVGEHLIPRKSTPGPGQPYYSGVTTEQRFMSAQGEYGPHLSNTVYEEVRGVPEAGSTRVCEAYSSNMWCPQGLGCPGNHRLPGWFGTPLATARYFDSVHTRLTDLERVLASIRANQISALTAKDGRLQELLSEAAVALPDLLGAIGAEVASEAPLYSWPVLAQGSLITNAILAVSAIVHDHERNCVQQECPHRVGVARNISIRSGASLATTWAASAHRQAPGKGDEQYEWLGASLAALIQLESMVYSCPDFSPMRGIPKLTPQMAQTYKKSVTVRAEQKRRSRSVPRKYGASTLEET